MHYLDLPEAERVEIRRIADLCMKKVDEYSLATHGQLPEWLDICIVGSFSHGDATEISDIDLVLVAEGDSGITLGTGSEIKKTKRIIGLCARELKLDKLLDAHILAPEIFSDRSTWRPIAYSLLHDRSFHDREEWRAFYADT